MKMKQLFIAMMLMGFQSAKAQLTLHPFVGGSMNTIYFFDVPSKSQNDINYLIGFQGGVGLDIPLGDVVSIEPILKYTQKGYTAISEYNWGFENYTNKESFRIHYIELPVMFNFNTELNDFNLVYSVGPYVACGFDARIISERSDGTTTETLDSKVNPDFYNDLVDFGYLNRIDFGMNVGVRAEISNFTIGLTGALSAQNFTGDLMRNANKFINYQLNIGYKIEL